MTLTDQKPMVRIIQNNITQNRLGGSCRTTELTWGVTDLKPFMADGGYDLIVGCDVVLHEGLVPLLVGVLQVMVRW